MPPDPTLQPLKLDALLARVGGDTALVSAMVSLFLDECPRYLADVRNAVAARDAAAIEGAAHRLRGSVSNFMTPAATQAALRLELLGRAADLDPSVDALGELEAELLRLTPALRELIT